MEVNELFKASKRESAVDLVVNNIKQLLIERKLQPGDRLPNELEISEGMGVSRGSVREAMKILSAFGLIDIRVGNGTYVCESPGDSLMDSLLFSFFVTNPDIENLYEFRHVIEIDVLDLILKHYDDNKEERQAMKDNLNRLEMLLKQGASSRQQKENDLEFHRLMGACTKNPLIERVYHIVIEFMEPSISITHRNQKGEIVYQVHKDIMEVIENKDYARIEKVITDSVDTWSKLQS
ncbi:MAG: FadR family transcriptional regulator [Clostridiales bacterium]|nr:FadR family transcriptional regulator [Clostridiales bacterium]